MTNLAEAVEQLSEFGIDEALLGLRHLLSELPDHDFRLERHGLESGIEALLAMNNRLAELGRGAGDEPKHVFEIPVDRYDWTEDGMEIIPKNQSGPNEYVKYDDYEKLYNTRPPVAGLAELTDEMRKEAVELIKQSVRDVEAENAAMKVPIRWDGITFGKPDWPCRFDEPQEKFNGNDERYKAGRNDGFQEGWNACVSEVKKLNQPKTEK